jgi:hypothetical protein
LKRKILNKLIKTIASHFIPKNSAISRAILNQLWARPLPQIGKQTLQMITRQC